jgi:hypothetical protein
MAEEVIRQPLTVEARFAPESVYVGFVMALGWFFSEFFGFCCQYHSIEAPYSYVKKEILE